MPLFAESVALLSKAIAFGLVSSFVAFLWAPLLIKILYKYDITRRAEYDATLAMGARKSKRGVPVMGGLLIIVTVVAVTMAFNWVRSFTWVPIGVMLLSAALGGVDDILNIYGKKRRNRNVGHTLRLIRVHRNWGTRLWLAATLPWTIFKRTSLWLGSHPGKGIHVHEKILLQAIAGGFTAWWIYFKLAEHWREIWIPFDGFVNIGIWMVPLIVLLFFLTANAVNVADGMDGLAGGALSITFAALTLLAWILGFQEIALLNATTMGAVLTYTYFNVKPARFQMGDVGSLGLGALLAINTIVMQKLVLLPLFGFIFYVELLSVIIQVLGRTFLGKRIFQMAPLHHHFELRGWSEE